MQRVGIIGGGIAGMACAHFLHPHFEISLFDQNYYIGGHSNTVMVSEGDKDIAIDTGFMVFNKVTYPLLTRLFEQLDVAIQPTDMSFSVQHVPLGIDWRGADLPGIFGQRKNLFSPRFWRFLLDLDRFNKDAVETVKADNVDGLTLGDYMTQNGYHPDVMTLYLVPMSASIWSSNPDQIRNFPARTLLRFFYNHGFLGRHTQHPWFTVSGGSQAYVKKILAPFVNRVFKGYRAVSVNPEASGQVTVTFDNGHCETFDKVIIAAHADEALAMLSRPSDQQQALLSCFTYQSNRALLHTDVSVMPKTKRCWGAWNYRILPDSEGKEVTSTHYWMNQLQRVSKRQNYFVSINGEDTIAPERVLKTMDYTHPVYSLASIAAQKQLPILNQQSSDGIYFCGSYFRYGFHEDALLSAYNLCEHLLGQAPWG